MKVWINQVGVVEEEAEVDQGLVGMEPVGVVARMEVVEDIGMVVEMGMAEIFEVEVVGVVGVAEVVRGMKI